MAVSKRIIMKQKIQELKEMGLSKTEIIRQFEFCAHSAPPFRAELHQYPQLSAPDGNFSL